MAHQKVIMGIILIMASMLWPSAYAQSSDCTNVIISLSPCLNYISGNSSSPSSSCCMQLRTVVSSQPQCLCQILNGGGSSLGLNINQSQALALPKACNVQTPPVSQCSALSPVGSPGEAPFSSPSTKPRDGGSKTGPSAGDGSSGENSIELAVPLLFCLLFITSYVSTSTMS